MNLNFLAALFSKPFFEDFVLKEMIILDTICLKIALLNIWHYLLTW